MIGVLSMAKVKPKKSVLDHMPVHDSTFREAFNGGLCVVSECPTCGSPIYGKSKLLPDEAPIVKRSCKCHDACNKELGMEHLTK